VIPSDSSPLRIVRGASADGAWEMMHAPLPDALRGVVRDRYGFAEGGTRFPARNESATAAVVLVISFGAPFRIADAADAERMTEHPLGFVGGLSEAHAVSQATGDVQCIQVMLTPLGAHRLLGGLPMHALANRTVGLDALLGAEGERLASRLHDAPGWEARFGIVDGWMAERVGRADAPPAGVAHAWRRLGESDGRMEMGALAREIGCSRKYLAARFREHVGLAPKAVARVLRFERATRLLGRAGADVRWSALALACGYYDQAHLIRDFRQFSGQTPGAYLRARLDGRPSAD
jgi:AraC-like DNA-binding protein